MRGEPCLIEDRGDQIAQPRKIELSRRDVDGDDEIDPRLLTPESILLAGHSGHMLADLHDRTRVLGDGNELRGRKLHAVDRPAYQRLGADDPEGSDVVDRLVVHDDLAALDGSAEPVLEV